MPAFNNKNDGLSFMQFYEPLFIDLLNRFYFSRDGIEIKRNENIYGVDCTFIHPLNGKEVGVELKTTKTYFNSSVSNFAVYESSQGGYRLNEIHQYVQHQPVILAYLDWQRRRILIIRDYTKLSELYNFNSLIGLKNESIKFYYNKGKKWRIRLVPIDNNIEWFDDVIYLAPNDSSCQLIEAYSQSIQ